MEGVCQGQNLEKEFTQYVPINVRLSLVRHGVLSDVTKID